jgi:uncharacterized membrane protein YphA (DoxX/SURF4 family)
MLTWRLRIAVLWIFFAVGESAVVALFMFQPGVISDMMGGKLYGADIHSAGVQISMAVYWLAPVALAYLTLVLKGAASRWMNAVIGAVSAVGGISILLGQPNWTSAGVNFVVTVETVAALLIVWHAWKWPRGAEVTPTREGQEPTRQSPELTRH